MPIDFPTGPTTGDVYSYQGKSWRYSGTAWDALTPAFGDAFLPAGSIIQWSASTAPANWLICDGAAVSRNTFSSLFAAIGTLYGAGNGTTTFNLPDLRGRVAVGLDSTQTEFDTLGESGGAKTVTLTEAQMPSHTHKFGYRGGTSAQTNTAYVIGTSITHDPNNLFSDTSATGGGQAHNNLQPYEVLHYIIKASAGTTAGDSELATRLGVAEAAVGQRALSSNAIINGGFDIWQRGTSFTATTASYLYCADRWNMFSSSTGRTYSRRLTTDTTNLPDIQYCVRAAKDSGNTNNAVVRLWTDVESVNSIPYAGKTVTLSFYARRGDNYSALGNGLGVQLITGTGTDQNWGHAGYTGSITAINQTATLTATWQRFSYTVAIASNVSQIGTNFAFTPTGTAGANDWFEVTGVQLEAGAVATPFKRNAPSIQAELAACQRYYYRQTANAVGNYLALGFGWGSNGVIASIFLPVPLRVPPTGFDAGNLRVFDGWNAASTVSSVTLSSSTQHIATLDLGSSGITQFRPYYLLANTAPSFIGINAEL